MHGLIGVLVLTGFLVAVFIEARRRPYEYAAVERLRWMLYVLPLPLIQLLTAYGIFTLRRWGRVLALLFSRPLRLGLPLWHVAGGLHLVGLVRRDRAELVQPGFAGRAE